MAPAVNTGSIENDSRDASCYSSTYKHDRRCDMAAMDKPDIFLLGYGVKPSDIRHA